MTQSNVRELRLSRLVDAPRDVVFRAWTEPEHVKQWFGPDGMAATEAAIDLRPGGGYRIVVQSPDGFTLTVLGTYREVSPPSRLVYTWRWENGVPDSYETLVSIDFHERGAQTEIDITHGGFPPGAEFDQYQSGWGDALTRFTAPGFLQL